jgi:N-acetylmuramoyl-L-alanine amidase
MINTNPHRFASFRVLRAPDVPSVLLELGYLSNPDDEKLLRDPDWRAKAVSMASAAAIKAFSSPRRQGCWRVRPLHGRFHIRCIRHNTL